MLRIFKINSKYKNRAQTALFFSYNLFFLNLISKELSNTIKANKP